MPPSTTAPQYAPPDGGWGWIVVFGSFISIGFSYAFPKAITVFFKEIQEIFGTSYSEIAWISSIMLAVMYAGENSSIFVFVFLSTGPVSSILVNKYGSRPIMIAGGILASFGMIASSFCNSVLQLYMCVGVIGGLGLAFNLQPALTMIGKYFYKKRPIANGLAMAGSPVFLSTLAPLNQFLFNAFGWKGSFLILGGLLLNCCVAGSLMRPVGPKPAQTIKKDVEKATEDSTLHKNDKKSVWQTINKYLDLTLFKHRGFLIYLSGNVIMFLGFFAPIVFLAPYAKHKGIDEYSAAFLLSILAFVDMFARPSMGLIANSKYIRPRIQYFFSFAVLYNGVCHILCPLAETYTGLVVYAVLFGLAFGMVSSLLVDITKDYKYMYFVCGIIVVVSSIWLFIGNAINYRLLAKEKKLEDERQNALKNADSKEVEPLTHKESEEVLNRSSKMQDSPSEKETNI
ncbi:Monocarboxylate transporter 2, partial [Ophiophagus hannah]